MSDKAAAGLGEPDFHASNTGSHILESHREDAPGLQLVRLTIKTSRVSPF